MQMQDQTDRERIASSLTPDQGEGHHDTDAGKLHLLDKIFSGFAAKSCDSHYANRMGGRVSACGERT